MSTLRDIVVYLVLTKITFYRVYSSFARLDIVDLVGPGTRFPPSALARARLSCLCCGAQSSHVVSFPEFYVLTKNVITSDFSLCRTNEKYVLSERKKYVFKVNTISKRT